MLENRPIDVRKQTNLPLARTFDLCVKGISHRLLRSVLTLAVVILAVAFFMFLLSENALIGATAKGVGKENADQLLATRLLSRLFNAPTSVTLSRRLSEELHACNLPTEEYARVTGWTPARVQRLAEQCAWEQSYLKFFDFIPVGKRTILVNKLKGREIFRRLAIPAEYEAFTAGLKPMLDLNLPGGLPAFSVYLKAYGDYEQELTTFTAAWGSAVAAMTKATASLTGNSAVELWLCGASPAQLRAWTDLATGLGFDLNSTLVDRMRDQLRLGRLKEDIAQKLGTPETRAQWRTAFADPRQLSTQDKLLRLDDARVVDLLDGAYTRQQLAEVAAQARYQGRLSQYAAKLSGVMDPDAGDNALSARQAFLLFISFLVCMVGIANAMLMSITERFREIATMKCLGATDRYILIQFMLEAGLQGVVGGTLGMLIGFAIALVKDTLAFRSYVFAYWPMGSVLLGVAISMAAGVFLAMLASIYPAWAASRMQPMEAMRVE